MRLRCYALHDFAPKIIPAPVRRDWMDAFSGPHPYRCLPLPIANTCGWQILCPVPLEITWSGGKFVADLKVTLLKPHPGGAWYENFCKSNFGRGIVTMHVGYLFQTEPGWDLLATGPFNEPKQGASPLTGIIEADWSPYTFTMNWQLDRPGILRFEEDEPYCSILPVQIAPLVECEPEILRLSDAPELDDDYAAFVAARNEFLERLENGDRSAGRQPWQRDYFAGRYPDGRPASRHTSRLRLKAPVDRRFPSRTLVDQQNTERIADA